MDDAANPYEIIMNTGDVRKRIHLGNLFSGYDGVDTNSFMMVLTVENGTWDEDVAVQVWHVYGDNADDTVFYELMEPMRVQGEPIVVGPIKEADSEDE